MRYNPQYILNHVIPKLVRLKKSKELDIGCIKSFCDCIDYEMVMNSKDLGKDVYEIILIELLLESKHKMKANQLKRYIDTKKLDPANLLKKYADYSYTKDPNSFKSPQKIIAKIFRFYKILNKLEIFDFTSLNNNEILTILKVLNDLKDIKKTIVYKFTGSFVIKLQI